MIKRLKTKQLSALALVVAMMAMLLSGIVAIPKANAAPGGGVVGGSGGSGSGSYDVAHFVYDDPVGFPPAYGQGTGVDSIEAMLNASGIPTPTANGGSAAKGNLVKYTQVKRACEIALKDASQRGGFGNDMEKSRVIGFWWGYDTANGAYSGFDGGRGNQHFRDAVKQWVNGGYAGLSGKYWSSAQGTNEKGLVKNRLLNTLGPEGNYDMVEALCAAENESEPKAPNYDLKITTSAQNTFVLPGGTAPVYDLVTTSNTGGISEGGLVAKITLNWDGYGDNAVSSGNAVKSSTKTCTLNSNAANQCKSTTFTPADLGLTYWHGGRYWYNVSVAKQGMMAAAVSHGDRATTSERWTSNGYTLSVSTKHQAPSDMKAGSTIAVSDLVTATNNANGGGILENLNATAIMHWDGFPVGNPATSQKLASKPFTMKSKGDTKTPEFKPSDFGFTVWPAGQFWFSVSVPRQANNSLNMQVAYTSPDRDTGEVFELAPNPPKKQLYAADGKTPLSDEDVQASNMPFFAKITGSAHGATQLTLFDHVASLNVLLGNNGSVTSDTIYVLDPSGNKVNANITISKGKVTDKSGKSVDGQIVKAVIGNAASGAKPLAEGDYVLWVKNTPKPTGSDFHVFDYSQACWLSPTANEVCLNGGDEEGEKVTPKPDKGWVLDKDGALVTNDPEWTNEQGADGMTFMHGDSIAAVVNDYLAKSLSSALDSYEIADDWTDSAKYVDFTKPGTATVLVQWPTTPAGKWEDVTSDFTFKVVDGVGGKYHTIANAKPGSQFLAKTKKLSKETPVKLVIEGTFRPVSDETNTHGNKIVLTNSGWVKWNNEEKPTNKPPVFVWNPDPDKEVLGNPEQGGQDENINGQMVFPGQSVKYQIKLDTHIPEGMAYDIDNFGMIDYYDPQITPDRFSIEATGRNGVIAKSNYTVTWDDNDPRNFKLLFKKDFIQDYLKTYAYGNDGKPVPDQDGRRYIIVTFTAKVDGGVNPGDVITNKAVQLVNKSVTPTPEPEVVIPPTEPDKEDLACDTKDPATGLLSECSDIDGKLVMKGDHIDYRLLMDARPAASKFAYLVHKLGMSDQPMIREGNKEPVSALSSGYLSLYPEDIKVVVNQVGSDAKDKFKSGQDVTDMFNISIENDVAYIFAKTVDTPNPQDPSQIIPGNPQPESLEKYASAAIAPLTDPGIDQDLLGNTYWIYLRTTVEKEANDHVIENEAVQNFENMSTVTKQVVNPLTELKPEKEVNVVVGGENMNGKDIELNSNFIYTLRSSLIPGNRAYKTSEWNIVDNYPQEFDSYTGQWMIRTQKDIYLNKTLVAKAGDVIASSKYLSESEASRNIINQVKMILGKDLTKTVTDMIGSEKISAIEDINKDLDSGEITGEQWYKSVNETLGTDLVAKISSTIGQLKSLQLDILLKNIDNVPALTLPVTSENVAKEIEAIVTEKISAQDYAKIQEALGENSVEAIVTGVTQYKSGNITEKDLNSVIADVLSDEKVTAITTAVGDEAAKSYLDTMGKLGSLITVTENDDSDNVPAFQRSFKVEDQDGKLTVTALKDSYFDVINTRLDLPQGWEALVQFTRIKPGNAIRNSFTENYNHVPREPEEVVTKTPEGPAIEIIKYELEKGPIDGRSPFVEGGKPSKPGKPSTTLPEGSQSGETSQSGDVAQSGDTSQPLGKPGRITILGIGEDVKIGFQITNTGDVPLVNVEMKDVTVSGHGVIKDITCKPPLEGWMMMPGDVSLCEGLLTGLMPGEHHKDVVTVEGESVYTGEPVTDEDAWEADVEPEEPAIEIIKYELSKGIKDGVNTKDNPLVVTDGKPIDIGFQITNTGNVPLKDIVFTDTVLSGSGSIDNITCKLPDREDGGESEAQSGAQSGSSEASDRKLITGATVNGSDLGGVILDPGEQIHCKGTLSGVQPGETHVDYASVTGKSVYTGTSVDDNDDWHLLYPIVPPKGAITGEGLSVRNMWLLATGVLLVVVAAGSAYGISRKRRMERLG